MDSPKPVTHIPKRYFVTPSLTLAPSNKENQDPTAALYKLDPNVMTNLGRCIPTLRIEPETDHQPTAQCQLQPRRTMSTHGQTIGHTTSKLVGRRKEIQKRTSHISFATQIAVLVCGVNGPKSEGFEKISAMFQTRHHKERETPDRLLYGISLLRVP